MADTSIEWTEKVWNPVTGCTKVSQGCKNCYAERVFPRAYGKDRKFTDVQCHEERLDSPLRWRRPSRIFVNSMSDLFHEAVSFEFIDRAMAVMACSPRHVFQVLTKRPQRMLEYFGQDGLAEMIAAAAGDLFDSGWGFQCSRLERKQVEHVISLGHDLTDDDETQAEEELLPLNNLWVGVSVEDQKTADERIPLLLQTPAAVRWISYEPALGALDLRDISAPTGEQWDVLDKNEACDACAEGACDGVLDWVVCGGESGPNARPMHPDWARSVRDQCQAAGVPFFFKQWGEWVVASRENGIVGSMMPETGERFTWLGSDGRTQHPSSHGLADPVYAMAKIGKKAAGRLLDGREWNEYPEVQRG